jgi:hypothetical protein
MYIPAGPIQSRSAFPSNSGSRAKFTAIRRASSQVSTPAWRAVFRMVVK